MDLTPHLEAGQTWLEECGITTCLDEVFATMGAQHGLFCVLTSILSFGDLLLTKSLTYMPVCAMAVLLGIRMMQVEMDAVGAVPESFEALCQTSNPRAFYLTPTLQAPTTVTLSEERHQAIAGIAARHGVILIEDDLYRPLKPDRPAPLSTRVPHDTICVTSLSKAVAPGLRVGFLRAPERLAPELRQAVNLNVWMTPPLTPAVATRLIQDGTESKLAARQRRLAVQPQSLARSILGQFDSATNTNGLHIWLPLPDGIRADVFRAKCTQHGVLVSEARSFAPRACVAPDAVCLCLSHEPNGKRLEKGRRTVADLVQESSFRFELNI